MKILNLYICQKIILSAFTNTKTYNFKAYRHGLNATTLLVSWGL